MSYKTTAACSAIIMGMLSYNMAHAADQQVERGKMHFVATGGCHDYWSGANR